MCPRTLLLSLVLATVYPTILLCQQKPEPTQPNAPQEFPLVLEKAVNAGKTEIGAKVQAKLLVATLVNGKVIPRNAVFSGEVVESTARTKTDPSRIGIRMDSVTWKEGSEPIKIYLTSWYYPTVADPGQNLRYGPDQPASRTWDGQGQYPDQNSHVYRPFPGSDTDKGSGVPSTANPVQSKDRVLMKDVDVEHLSDGSIVLVCKHNNLKLDRLTTYVFAPGDPVASR
jgi:hypothetical protein